MKKLDFDSYLVSELSKVLFSDAFNVYYVYRHHNKPSIIVVPVDDYDDIALCDLKQLCLSSKSLGHRYVISLEHTISNRSYINNEGRISLFRRVEYELTMPNNPEFKSIVKSLDKSHFEHNLVTLNLRKGGVK